MKFMSTKGQSPAVDFKTAVLSSMPDDGGLYVPETLPTFTSDFLKSLSGLHFHEIAQHIASLFLKDIIPEIQLQAIIEDAYNFPTVLQTLTPTVSCLELFHGPTLAFKDYAARFMARIMSYLIDGDTQPLTILVATSGDTGGAVADAFAHINNIKVVILYPQGRISELQELQLTTQGNHVQAIQVKGTFDDCQALVKRAFADESLKNTLRLSSANSINIARLIPQMFYYAYAVSKKIDDGDIIISVPSGNFGNLTAAMMTKKMGLPIKHFIAACNSNDTVPRFFKSDVYEPHKTIHTLSNAMDVSDPSNFQRLMHLYKNNKNVLQMDLSAYAFSDNNVRQAMRECYQQYNYIIDPHTACSYLGLKKYGNVLHRQHTIFVATAHPAKFADEVERILHIKLPLPDELERLKERVPSKMIIDNNYQALLKALLI